MALAIITTSELLNFIPTKHHSELITIYSKIPTDLIKFLDQRNIVRQLNFKRTMEADNKSIGNEYNKQWNSFINHLCHSIKQVFREENVTCIDPHDLAVDISNRYLKIQSTWARRAQTLSATLEFNNIYTVCDNDIQVARTHVDVKVKVEENCEDNCFDTNQYFVSYDVEIKLKAVIADGHKVRALCEIINRDGTAKAIEYIKLKT
jgi:hypothetical protein